MIPRDIIIADEPIERLQYFYKCIRTKMHKKVKKNEIMKPLEIYRRPLRNDLPVYSSQLKFSVESLKIGVLSASLPKILLKFSRRLQ